MNHLLVNPNQTDPSENIEVSTYKITIPESFQPGYFENPDGTGILLGENENFQWGWYYFGHTVGPYSVIFEGLPGYEPISGICSEWDPRNRVPFYGNALFYTYGVMRANGSVKVLGNHSYGNPLHCAAGYIKSR